ncbi:MAG: MarR family transcriptional regulator [Negativicutes bacterium]|nr:MarR family transcriptional regulator [Negativicutes bacterium]
MKNNELHIYLGRLFRSHWRETTNRFAKIGLSSAQPKLLHYLSNHPGAMQREIADGCSIESATATSILSGMEQAKLIYREADGKDRRIMRTFLTEKGQQTQQEIDRIFFEVENICYQGFSEAEIEQLYLFLDRMYQNMQKTESE